MTIIDCILLGSIIAVGFLVAVGLTYIVAFAAGHEEGTQDLGREKMRPSSRDGRVPKS